MSLKKFISLLALLPAFSNYGCGSDTKASAEITDSQRLSKELQETSWQVYSHLESARRDTMLFSFGYYSTGDELNFLVYNSDEIKEQCEFTVAKDTIIVDSYSTAPSPLVIEFDSCRVKSKLLYRENVLSYISIDTYCGNIHKKINLDSLRIELKRL